MIVLFQLPEIHLQTTNILNRVQQFWQLAIIIKYSFDLPWNSITSNLTVQ